MWQTRHATSEIEKYTSVYILEVGSNGISRDYSFVSSTAGLRYTFCCNILKAACTILRSACISTYKDGTWKLLFDFKTHGMYIFTSKFFFFFFFFSNHNISQYTPYIFIELCNQPFLCSSIFIEFLVSLQDPAELFPWGRCTWFVYFVRKATRKWVSNPGLSCILWWSRRSGLLYTYTNAVQ